MMDRLQITFHGVDHSDAVEERIRSKAASLERFSDDITSCHVTVETPHRRHQKGNLYSVRLDVRLRGKEIVVGRDRGDDHGHEDVYVVINETFDIAVRQLEDYVQRRRGSKR